MKRTFGKLAAAALAAGALTAAVPAAAATFAQVGITGGTPTVTLTNTGGGAATLGGSGSLQLNMIDSMGVMGAPIAINFTLNGVSNGAANVSMSGANSFIDQNFDGGFSFTFANNGTFNGQTVNAGDLVFGGSFTEANFRGRIGSSTGSILSGAVTNFTNGAVSFDAGSISNFEFGLAGISPALGGSAAGGINGFTAVINGKFDNDGVISGPGIPEPATWAMMMLGFGMLGGALRRRSALVLAA